MSTPVLHMSYRERQEFWESKQPYVESFNDFMPVDYKDYIKNKKKRIDIKFEKARKATLEILE